MISDQFITQVALKRDDIASFSEYPFSIPAIHSLTEITFHPKVTFFIGENGSGKSTLLEAMAVSLGFNPEGGSRNFNFSTRASHSSLFQHLRISKGVKRPKDSYFFRAESYFNLASEIEKLDAEPSSGPPVIDSYGRRSLHEQSHGESFMALLMNRFGGKGLYLLDEPEAALSPARQLAMIARMNDLVNDGSQIIIATHSPILLGFPDALIYKFDSGSIETTTYKETDHYQITRSFLNNPEGMLKQLLTD